MELGSTAWSSSCSRNAHEGNVLVRPPHLFSIFLSACKDSEGLHLFLPLLTPNSIPPSRLVSSQGLCVIFLLS